MRIVALILSAMAVVYGVLLTFKPHLAIPRKKAATTSAVWIARVKGLIAVALGAALFWRSQN